MIRESIFNIAFSDTAKVLKVVGLFEKGDIANLPFTKSDIEKVLSVLVYHSHTNNDYTSLTIDEIYSRLHGERHNLDIKEEEKRYRRIDGVLRTLSTAYKSMYGWNKFVEKEIGKDENLYYRFLDGSSSAHSMASYTPNKLGGMRMRWEDLRRTNFSLPQQGIYSMIIRATYHGDATGRVEDMQPFRMEQIKNLFGMNKTQFSKAGKGFYKSRLFSSYPTYYEKREYGLKNINDFSSSQWVPRGSIMPSMNYIDVAPVFEKMYGVNHDFTSLYILNRIFQGNFSGKNVENFRIHDSEDESGTYTWMSNKLNGVFPRSLCRLQDGKEVLSIKTLPEYETAVRETMRSNLNWAKDYNNCDAPMGKIVRMSNTLIGNGSRPSMRTAVVHEEKLIKREIIKDTLAESDLIPTADKVTLQGKKIVGEASNGRADLAVQAVDDRECEKRTEIENLLASVSLSTLSSLSSLSFSKYTDKTRKMWSVLKKHYRSQKFWWLFRNMLIEESSNESFKKELMKVQRIEDIFTSPIFTRDAVEHKIESESIQAKQAGLSFLRLLYTTEELKLQRKEGKAKRTSDAERIIKEREIAKRKAIEYASRTENTKPQKQTMDDWELPVANFISRRLFKDKDEFQKGLTQFVYGECSSRVYYPMLKRVLFTMKFSADNLSPMVIFIKNVKEGIITPTDGGMNFDRNMLSLSEWFVCKDDSITTEAQRISLYRGSMRKEELSNGMAQEVLDDCEILEIDSVAKTNNLDLSILDKMKDFRSPKDLEEYLLKNK